MLFPSRLAIRTSDLPSWTPIRLQCQLIFFRTNLIFVSRAQLVMIPLLSFKLHKYKLIVTDIGDKMYM